MDQPEPPDGPDIEDEDEYCAWCALVPCQCDRLYEEARERRRG